MIMILFYFMKIIQILLIIRNIFLGQKIRLKYQCLNPKILFQTFFIINYYLRNPKELKEVIAEKANFKPEDYVAIPFEVGQWNIIAYIHKSRGCIELEPGLLNLFPFSKVRKLAGKRPDGVFIFGCPKSDMSDLGYHYDKENKPYYAIILCFSNIMFSQN